MRTSILLICSCLISLGLKSQTNVSGTINSNTTFTVSGSPYLITGKVVVRNGITLTVEPGVIIESTAVGNSITINGTLRCIGNSGKRIACKTVEWIFTDSAADYYNIGGGCEFAFTKFEMDYASSAYPISMNNMDLKVSNSSITNARIFLNYGSGQSHFLSENNKYEIGVFNFNGFSEASYMCYKDTFIDFGIYNVRKFRISECLFTTNKGMVGSFIAIVDGNGANTFDTEGIIECNTFINRKFNSAISIQWVGGSSLKLPIRNNLFENNANDIDIYFSSRSQDSFSINNNNFINTAGKTLSVRTGSNVTGSINAKSNFWNTTDTVKIKSKWDVKYSSINLVYKSISNASNTACFSVANISKSNQLFKHLIFPNPTKDNITIKSSNIQKVKIFNSIGQCMLEKEYFNVNEVNFVLQLIQGIYTVQIFANGGISQTKLLVN